MYSDKADVWGCKKEEKVSDEQKWIEGFGEVWKERGIQYLNLNILG